MHVENWEFKDLVLLNLEGKIEAARDKLETESSTNVLWDLQGKLIGFKALKEKVEDEFGPLEGTMVREDIPNVTTLGRAALENFQKSITEDGEAWMKIDRFVGEEEERMKDDLFENGAVGRDMKLAHGVRDGLRLCATLMDTITETLQEVKTNPSLFDQVEEQETTEEEFPEEDFNEIDEAGEDPQDDETDIERIEEEQTQWPEEDE